MKFKYKDKIVYIGVSSNRSNWVYGKSYTFIEYRYNDEMIDTKENVSFYGMTQDFMPESIFNTKLWRALNDEL